MALFTNAKNYNLRAYKTIATLTDTVALSSNGRIVDTKNAVSLCYGMAIKAIIPITGTFNIDCTYTLKESDTPGGPFVDVPLPKLIIKEGQEDLSVSYSGGGVAGQNITRYLEVGAFGTERYLRMDIDYSGSIAGGAGPTGVSIYRAFITSETVQPK